MIFRRIRLLLIITIAMSIAPLRAADPAKPRRVDVAISGLAYRPAQIKVHVGDTVIWTNNDDRDHTVAASDGTFKSENLKTGQSFEFSFKKAGKHAYGCSYHPRMKGLVIVEN